MKKLNPPFLRNRTGYFLARVVISIAFLAAMILVIARTDSTSRAQGCTTDPVVANNLDSGAGSLRQAITDACAGSTITFNMATVTSPISLTSAELLINKNLTITGPGATTLTVERSSAPATPQFRIFNVTSGTTVSISGLTVTNGRTPDGILIGNNGQAGGDGGGIRSTATSLTLSDVHLINNRTGNGANAPILPGDGGSGGAVFSENGLLTMTNSTISGNRTGDGGFAGNHAGGGRGGDGGGIYIENGTLNLTNVKITNNSGGNSTEPGGFGGIGGGIYTNTNTVATLTNCTVSNNSAGLASGIDGSDGFSGGINNDGVMTVIGSTISGNTSLEVGGGFLSRIRLTLINSTISGNSGSLGSAIVSDSGNTLSLTNCTITNNSSSSSTAIISFGQNSRVRNTIIAGNPGGDTTGTFISLGNNVIGRSFMSGFVNGVNGDKVGTDAAPLNPGLAPLADNGGPTQTHALLASSPALDAGNNCVLDNSCSPALGMSLTTDQRGAGFIRAADSADADTTQTVDIGAFEAQASVEDIPNKSTPEDTLLSFSFNVGDASAITNVSASSSNTVLVPNANLGVSGSGSTRTLDITPASDQSGTTTITVTVTSGTESMSDTFVLTVTPVNDAPVDIALSNNNVADNSPSNTLVGTFATSDPDPLQTFTYSLVSGTGSTDNASFSISGDQLRTASTFDFETKSSFAIRVRSTDGGGLFVEEQFTINVVNGPDTPGAIAFSSSVFSVGEGDGNATITLTRTGGADNSVIVKVNIADVTTSPADYVLAPGDVLVTWVPGDSANKTVSLPIVDDALDEPNETLSLMVVPVSGGATAGVPSLATLTILDNDRLPTTITLSSSVNPSDFGQTVIFTATVTGSGGTPTGTVQFKDGGTNLGLVTLTEGVAVEGLISPTPGTHTITAEYSGDANFLPSTATLTQVVKAAPTLSIDDVSVMEGNSGTTNLVFTVSLSAASAVTVIVNFATADGTATTSDNDYQSALTAVTFGPGELTKTITVVVKGDQKSEVDETVLVNLSNPQNATVADGQGVGTILNDDDLQLILDESGPAADQAAAFDSFLFTRDPFKVLSIADWFDFGGSADRNTRVLIFAMNLTLNQGELPSSVVVNLVDGNNQTHDVPAEDVRALPNTAFTQVVFRLPDSLAPGVCHVTIKAQGRTSNTGTIRIAP